MSAPTIAAKGFVAGALSVVTVMFAAWWLVQSQGFVPATAPPLWSWAPPIPPFGVPRVINLAFWGGVWALVLALLFQKLEGVGYWLAWILAGTIAVAAGAIFVVPAIKGLPITNLTPQRFMVSGFLNGMFGLGAAIWLMVLGGRSR